jgi:hypothetical protein
MGFSEGDISLVSFHSASNGIWHWLLDFFLERCRRTALHYLKKKEMRIISNTAQKIQHNTHTAPI